MRIFRIITGTLLAICGIGIAGFSGYLLFQGTDLSAWMLIGGVIFGVLLASGGIAIAMGVSIREIIEILLLGS